LDDVFSLDSLFPKDENINTNITTTTKNIINVPAVKLNFLKKLEISLFPLCNNGKLYILLLLVSYIDGVDVVEEDVLGTGVLLDVVVGGGVGVAVGGVVVDDEVVGVAVGGVVVVVGVVGVVGIAVGDDDGIVFDGLDVILIC
jgi:hypothetical protein